MNVNKPTKNKCYSFGICGMIHIVTDEVEKMDIFD